MGHTQKKSFKERLAKMSDKYSLTDTLNFGKYGKRYSIEWIIKHDVSYIDWCLGKKLIKLDKESQILFMYEYDRYQDQLADYVDDKLNWGGY